MSANLADIIEEMDLRLEAGDYEAAIVSADLAWARLGGDILKERRDLEPERAEVLLGKGLAQLELGKFDAARGTYQTALSVLNGQVLNGYPDFDPERALSHYYIGLTLQLAMKPSEAILAFDAAHELYFGDSLRDDPDLDSSRASLLVQRAKVHTDLGRSAAATQDLNAADTIRATGQFEDQSDADELHETIALSRGWCRRMSWPTFAIGIFAFIGFPIGISYVFASIFQTYTIYWLTFFVSIFSIGIGGPIFLYRIDPWVRISKLSFEPLPRAILEPTEFLTRRIGRGRVELDGYISRVQFWYDLTARVLLGILSLLLVLNASIIILGLEFFSPYSRGFFLGIQFWSVYNILVVRFRVFKVHENGKLILKDRFHFIARNLCLLPSDLGTVGVHPPMEKCLGAYPGLGVPYRAYKRPVAMLVRAILGIAMLALLYPLLLAGGIAAVGAMLGDI